MYRHAVARVTGLLCSLLVAAPSVRAQDPQPLKPESFYPKYAAAGRTTTINVAVLSPDRVQAAEITPSTGITITGVKGTGSGSEQNIGWWEVTLDVASGAAPGERALVLVLPNARTAPIAISIAAHAPSLANVRLDQPQPNQPAALTLDATDAAADLGDAPYVWMWADCGEEPIVGALRGRLAGGALRVALPNLRKEKCDLQLRVTDAQGLESNVVKTTVSFPRTAASEAAASAAAASTQEWTEFASPADRFTVLFPGQPAVAETTWTTQYGAILPARVYAGTSGPGRYSVTVVDYNPLERLLTERSRTLPALDLAIHDYGLGYWKTDLRSSVVFAAAKFLERDGKVTNMFSNFADGVVGMQLQFVANADQARTLCSIYMHENRLVIAEATAPKGYPAPLIFQQSLGWLDADGNRIRYQFMNYNDPDLPKPPYRGR